MTDYHRLIRRIPLFSGAGIVAVVMSLAALLWTNNQADQQAEDRRANDHAACVRGNELRGDLRQFAGDTAAAFTSLLTVALGLGADDRTPEEQARVDEFSRRYQESVVTPLSVLAADDGPFAGRACS